MGGEGRTKLGWEKVEGEGEGRRHAGYHSDNNLIIVKTFGLS